MTGITNLLAAQLSQAAYTSLAKYQNGTNPALPAGWVANTTTGFSARITDSSGGINQLIVFVNQSTQQVVIAFKGTDDIPNFQSDLLNDGATAYSNIQAAAATALANIKTTYSGYTIMTDGHSLGGGMAQTFAVQNNLSGYGQNSLPVAAATISNDAQWNSQYSTWQSNHQTFSEVNDQGDPATWYYNKAIAGGSGDKYIATSTLTLTSTSASVEALASTYAGTGILNSYANILAGYEAYNLHSIGTVISLLQANAASDPGNTTTDLTLTADDTTVSADFEALAGDAPANSSSIPSGTTLTGGTNDAFSTAKVTQLSTTQTEVDMNMKDGTSQSNVVTSNSDGSYSIVGTGYSGTNLSGTVKYTQNTNVSASGATTATISGTGDTAALDNASITIASGAAATTLGNTINGSGNTISVGKNDNITIAAGQGEASVNDTVTAANPTTAVTDLLSDTLTFEGQSIQTATIGGISSGATDSYGRTYTVSGTTLTITKGSDSLTINNFQNGNFGVIINSSGTVSALPAGYEATGINNLGQIVGVNSDNHVSFLDNNGTFTTISVSGAFDTRVSGINDSGEIVGTYYTGPETNYTTHGFTDINGTITTLNIPNAVDTIVDGINNSGQIVGQYDKSDGSTHGFVDTSGTVTNIDFPGGTDPEVTGISNNGQIIVGIYGPQGNTSGFVYRNGQYTTVNYPGTTGNTILFGVNNNGQVIGRNYGNNLMYDNFVYDIYTGIFTTTTNLPSVDPVMGVNEVSASGINDHGQIVAEDNYNQLGYISNPIDGSAPQITTQSNSTVTVGSNQNATVTGNNDTVNGSTGNNITVNGNNDTTTVSTGGNVAVNGTADTVTSGTGDTVSVAGNGQVALSSADTVNMSSGTVNIGYNATANIVGNSNTINGNYSDNVILNGNSNTLTVNSGGYVWVGSGISNTINAANGDYVSLGGNGQVALSSADTVNMSSGTIDVGYNSTANIVGNSDTINGNYSDNVVLNGNSNTLTVNSGSYVWVGSGVSNTINAANGDYVSLGGNGQVAFASADTANISSGTVDVGYNSTAYLVGSSNTINGNYSDNVILNAAHDTLTINSGSYAWVVGSGIGNTVTAANGDYVDIAGNGIGAADADTVNMSNGSIEVDDSSTASIVGSGNTVSAFGTNDIIVNGSNNVINAASGDTITVVAGSSATINGSNLNIVAAAGDNITLNGTAGTNHITGSGSYTLKVNGVSKGTGNNYGTYGFAGDPSIVNAALTPGNNIIVQHDIADGNSTGAAAAEASLQQLQSVIASGSTAPQLEGAKWGDNVITWSSTDSAIMNSAAYQGEIQAAFDAWGAATGLTFEEVSNSSKSDINLTFFDLDTQTSGVVGYTSYNANNGQMQAGATIQLEDPGQDALIKGANGQLTYSGTDATFQQAVEHEIGHALGFADNNNPTSIMDYYLGSNNRTLGSNDIAAAQSLYGTTTASASTEAAYLRLIQDMASFGGNVSSGAVTHTPELYMVTGNMAANPLQAHH